MGGCRPTSGNLLRQAGELLPEPLSRITRDKDARRRALMRAAFFVDAAWAVPNLCLGAVEASAWFATLGAYYLLFAAMRMVMLAQMRKPGGYTQADARRIEWVCGVLLLTSVFVLSGIVTLVMKGEGSFVYPGLFVYAVATFAFYSLVAAIVNYVRLRSHDDMLVVVNCRINLTIALVSIFALEVAMLTAFGTADDAELRFVMPILTGTGVAAAITYLGVRSLIGSCYSSDA